MDRVLEHARAVAEREEMADPHLRNGGCLARERRSDQAEATISGRALLARRLEDREIALGRLRPRHRSARRIGALAHGMTADVVRQQAGDLGADRLGIAKRNQNAAPVASSSLACQ